MNAGDVAHAIQLALAPVFLLTGIAGILNVLAGRLARIIDRGRALTEGPAASEGRFGASIEVELHGLDCRRHLVSSAIASCTFAALLVCTVVAALFVEVLFEIELSLLLGVLFTGSTMALVLGLALFLREVHLAIKTVRIPIADRHR